MVGVFSPSTLLHFSCFLTPLTRNSCCMAVLLRCKGHVSCISPRGLGRQESARYAPVHRGMSTQHISTSQSSQSAQMRTSKHQTTIVAPTRLLCGLCMSNMTNVGTNLNGSHLMAWCGRFLSGREEQRRLLSFLTEFSQNTKWPSRVDCTRLEETWARSKRPWLDCLGVSPGV